MNRLELRASLSLASLFALRMLGLFLILPVFAVDARQMPGGDDPAWVGLVLGLYGLVQACLHIPLGALSDRIGRRGVIAAGMALFAAGAAVAAHGADQASLAWIAAGRALQGAGAVSAAITALVADLTREAHRTKAMAMIGGSIALTFALSLVIASPLHAAVGLAGMFWLMAALGAVSLLVIAVLVPKPAHAAASPVPFKAILGDPNLLRLNFGVLVLHACQVAMFMVVPGMLVDAGVPLSAHWQVYLPAVVASFGLMIKPILFAERGGRMRGVLAAAIVLLALVQLLFALAATAGAGAWMLGSILLLFFTAFNVLEALQPSLVSRFAQHGRGAAMGVYNTAQAFGLFVGGAAGGALLHNAGRAAVFVGCTVLLGLWLIIAAKMDPVPVRQQAAESSAR